MSLRKTTVRGGLWQGLAFGMQAVLQVVVLAILARRVTPGEFGAVTIAVMVTGFVTFVSRSGLGPAVVQRTELTPAHVRVAFTSSVVLGLLCSSVVFALAPWVAAFFHAPGVGPVIRFMSVSMLATSVSLTAEALVLRGLEFRKLTAVELVSYCVGNAGVSIPLALAGFGVWSVACGAIAQAVLKSSALLWLRPHPMRPLFDRRVARELFGYGSGLTLAQLLNYAAQQADYVVVGRVLGTAPLGLYERVFRLMQMPGYLVGEAADRVMFPAMSQIQDDPRRLAQAFLNAAGLVSLALVPVAGVLIVAAPEAVAVVLGPRWTAAVLPLQLLLVGVSVRTTVRLSDSLVRAVGAVYRSARVKAAFAVAVPLGAWAGHYWGLSGVAVGVTAASFLHFALMTRLTLQLTGARWRDVLDAHLPGCRLAVAAVALTLAVASALRWAGSPPLLVLAAVGTVNLLLVALLLRYRPHALGPHAGWFVALLMGSRLAGGLRERWKRALPAPLRARG